MHLDPNREFDGALQNQVGYEPSSHVEELAYPDARVE